MANISQVTITIHQPVETVWGQLMDPDKLQFWLTGFVSVEHISGDYGQTGSVSKLKFLERGKESEFTETAVVVKPNQQYSFDMSGTSFDVKTDIRLVSSSSHTEMTQTVQFFPKQLWMKLLMPLMKGAMKKRMEKELVRFKNFAESRS